MRNANGRRWRGSEILRLLLWLFWPCSQSGSAGAPHRNEQQKKNYWQREWRRVRNYRIKSISTPKRRFSPSSGRARTSATRTPCSSSAGFTTTVLAWRRTTPRRASGSRRPKGDARAAAYLEYLPIEEAAGAGRYAEALQLAEALAAKVEASQTKGEGKPRKQTAQTLNEVAWRALFA